MKNKILLKLAFIGSLSVGLQAEFLRDDSKNIVLDSLNGLIWQDDEVVKTTNRTWANAIVYCEGLSVGGYNDWRLPNNNELRSIIDKSRVNPSLSPVFENFTTSSYWSSTTHAANTDYALNVNFFLGFDSINFKTDGVRVRCVRAGL